MTPSTDLNAFKSISPENMRRLWNIRDSLRRTASEGTRDGGGSDTMPNIIDALKGIGKMGGVAHCILRGRASRPLAIWHCSR
jgi:hypothetical protein